eukprot:gb/GECG01014368.1/.p1 GENE.gb/GECG01014368.1/~~gb/GECG01014368.1/.p1  ORF type:complete len:159 (+),score=2.09 gb/GECG01014368.1/:1-477(+)
MIFCSYALNIRNSSSSVGKSKSISKHCRFVGLSASVLCPGRLWLVALLEAEDPGCSNRRPTLKLVSHYSTVHVHGLTFAIIPHRGSIRIHIRRAGLLSALGICLVLLFDSMHAVFISFLPKSTERLGVLDEPRLILGGIQKLRHDQDKNVPIKFVIRI